MIYILQNFLPILVATVAAFGFSAIYYMVLGSRWQQAAKVEADTYDRTGFAKAKPFLLSFMLEFWMCAILAGALILAPVTAGAWTTAFGTAIILWIGFVVPTTLTNYLFPGRSGTLMAIDCGHWLGVLLIMAGVLRLIGVEGPDA